MKLLIQKACSWLLRRQFLQTSRAAKGQGDPRVPRNGDLIDTRCAGVSRPDKRCTVHLGEAQRWPQRDEAVSVERRHGNSRDKSLATDYSIIKEHAPGNTAARDRCFVQRRTYLYVHRLPTEPASIRLTTIELPKDFPETPTRILTYIFPDRFLHWIFCIGKRGKKRMKGGRGTSENNVSQFRGSFMGNRLCQFPRKLRADGQLNMRWICLRNERTLFELLTAGKGIPFLF